MAWRPVIRVIKQGVGTDTWSQNSFWMQMPWVFILQCTGLWSKSQPLKYLMCAILSKPKEGALYWEKGDWPVGSDFHWGTSLVIQCLRIHLASDFCFMYLCFFIVKVYNGLWYLSSLWIVSFIVKIFIFVSFKINSLKKRINLTIQGMQVRSLVGELRSHSEAQTPQLLSLCATTRVYTLQWKILRASTETWCSQK